ncbi:MAG: DNA/RNA non-specific endonuclease [Chitinophagaceae bacterium]|nr:DNA/RNA non-specific endonuclease [Chitinophagaceae bacterium]
MKIPLQLLDRYEKENPVPVAEIPRRKKKIAEKDAITLDGQDKFLRRRAMLAEVAVEDFDAAFERYIGDNDLVAVNYFEVGLKRARSVGRLSYFDNIEMKPAVATAFLISPDLVVTNHHVFSSTNAFKDAKIEFDYRYDITGSEMTRVVFTLDPEKFFHVSEALDLCVIGVKEKDVSGNHTIRERGYLVLNKEIGKAGVGDFATVIQHPEGHFQQISLRENQILDISRKDALIYESDTARGSSGSPVFNDQWQVIALHSAGVPKKNEEGQYLDERDEIIEPIEGRIDADRIVWLSNRGTRVSAIMDHLFSDATTKGHPLILALNADSYSDERHVEAMRTATESGAAPSLGTTTPVPTNSPNVYINITIGEKGQVSTQAGTGVISGAPAFQSVDTTAFEKKIEEEIDFSECKGFDEYFMGDRTPLPALSNSLKNKVAKFIENPSAYILKYHHYSSVQHAIRCMPVYSAINIMGKRRYEELEGRTDNWFRDRRIDFDCQLNDAFYKYSNMDKGHMARREDAEWGTSIGFAEHAANMTCSYTNACPQVPALNRYGFGYYGDWGNLEENILEFGVKKEGGDQGRICVYNGPIFDSEDPVFKNIQIPLKYWKVVVWRNKSDQLKATGFMLSQEELMGDVELEALHFDQLFKNMQCSIAFIESKTGLRFNTIREWDTFSPGGNGEEESLVLGKDDLEKLILRHAE